MTVATIIQEESGPHFNNLLKKTYCPYDQEYGYIWPFFFVKIMYVSAELFEKQ